MNMKFATKVIVALTLLSSVGGANLRATSLSSEQEQEPEHDSQRRQLMPMYDFKDIQTWERIRNAVGMSQGIYHDGNMKMGKSQLSGTWTPKTIQTDGPVPYVSTIFNDGNERYVMAAFRGMDTGDEPTWLDAALDGGVSPGPFEKIMKKIRDSSFIDISGYNMTTESETIEFAGCEMNEYLLKNYTKFTYDPIIEDLEQCKQDNGNVACELYLVGHSQGGVFAQFTSLRIQNEIREVQEDETYNPFVFAFGSPAGFKNDTCDALDQNKVYNFMNLRKYDHDSLGTEKTVFDIAVTIGINNTNSSNGSIHLGHKFVFHNGNQGLKHYSYDDTSFKVEDPEYDLRDLTKNDQDRAKLKAHRVSSYQERLKEVANAGVPSLDGLPYGDACIWTDQCQGAASCISLPKKATACRYVCGTVDVTSIDPGTSYAIKRDGSSRWASMEGSGNDFQVKLRDNISDGPVVWNVRRFYDGYQYLFNINREKYAMPIPNSDKDVEGVTFIQNFNQLSQIKDARVTFVQNSYSDRLFQIKYAEPFAA